MLFRFHSEEEGKNGQLQTNTHTQRKKIQRLLFLCSTRTYVKRACFEKKQGNGQNKNSSKIPAIGSANKGPFLLGFSHTDQSPWKKTIQTLPRSWKNIAGAPAHTGSQRNWLPYLRSLGPQRRICYLQIPHTAKSEKRVAGRHAKIRHSPEPTKSWNLAGKSPSWTPCVVVHKQCKYIKKNAYILFILCIICV